MSLLNTISAKDLTADQLLAIGADDPEKLFTASDADQIKKEFRTLAKIWHSDHNSDPRSKDVMQRVQALYETANTKIKSDTWEVPNLLRFETTDKKRYQIKYLKKKPFELGEMYIADASVTYVVKKDDAKLFQNAKNTITNLGYPNADMEKRLKPILPEIKRTFETKDRFLMTLNKDPEAVLLSDLLAHQKGKIAPEHAAWMITRLHNLSCYLEWSHLTHNAITPENCLVTPKDHRISLVGGWWYAAKEGEKLQALPPKAASVAPPSVFDNPVANARLDLAMVRATGREILGDATGMTLPRDTTIPAEITRWVNGITSGNAQQDFKVWQDDILAKSFGARRFVEMKINPNDIYKL